MGFQPTTLVGMFSSQDQPIGGDCWPMELIFACTYVEITLLGSQNAISNKECRYIMVEPNIGLWKVAKIFHFLATFQVHPWTSLTFPELVPQIIEWLGKLVHEPLCGS